MRRGRPVPRIVLSPGERDTLERCTRRTKTAQALALRARIMLRCATGETHTAIGAQALMVNETGSNNIGVGFNAGAAVTLNDNISVGAVATSREPGWRTSSSRPRTSSRCRAMTNRRSG